MKISKTEFPRNLLEDIYGRHNKEDFVVTRDMCAGLIVALSLIPEKEEEIIYMRYRDKMSYRSISEVYGLSQERIRQIIVKAMRKLRHPVRSRYFHFGVENTINKEIQKAYERGCNDGYSRGFDEATLIAKGIEPGSSEARREKALQTTINDMNFSVRVFTCLARFGIETAADIASMDHNTILSVKLLGKQGIREVARRLREMGITDTAWDNEE